MTKIEFSLILQFLTLVYYKSFDTRNGDPAKLSPFDYKKAA